MRYPINNNGGRGRGNGGRGGRGGFRPRNPGQQNNPRHYHQRQQHYGSRPYRSRAPRASFRPQTHHQGHYQNKDQNGQNNTTPQNTAPQNGNGATNDTNNTPVTTSFQHRRDERAQRNNSPVPGNSASHGPSTSKRKRPHSPVLKEEYVAGSISHELALDYYFYYKNLKKKVRPTKRYD